MSQALLIYKQSTFVTVTRCQDLTCVCNLFPSGLNQLIPHRQKALKLSSKSRHSMQQAAGASSAVFVFEWLPKITAEPPFLIDHLSTYALRVQIASSGLRLRVKNAQVFKQSDCRPVRFSSADRNLHLQFS